MAPWVNNQILLIQTFISNQLFGPLICFKSGPGCVHSTRYGLKHRSTAFFLWVKTVMNAPKQRVVFFYTVTTAHVVSIIGLQRLVCCLFFRIMTMLHITHNCSSVSLSLSRSLSLSCSTVPPIDLL